MLLTSKVELPRVALINVSHLIMIFLYFSVSFLSCDILYGGDETKNLLLNTLWVKWRCETNV